MIQNSAKLQIIWFSWNLQNLKSLQERGMHSKQLTG